MKEQLAKIRSEALSALESVKDAVALDELRVKYLGKKGELTAVLKQMGKLTAEERPAMGQLANEVRAALESALETAARKMEAAALEMKEKGYIRHIGITNHRLFVAREAIASGNFETLQFPFCYLTTEKELELVAQCKAADMG